MQSMRRPCVRVCVVCPFVRAFVRAYNDATIRKQSEKHKKSKKQNKNLFHIPKTQEVAKGTTRP